jgi:hypothetical protein
MNTITRGDQSRGLTSLQEQVNRLFEDNFTRDRSGHADLATWAPCGLCGCRHGDSGFSLYQTQNRDSLRRQQASHFRL